MEQFPCKAEEDSANGESHDHSISLRVYSADKDVSQSVCCDPYTKTDIQSKTVISCNSLKTSLLHLTADSYDQSTQCQRDSYSDCTVCEESCEFSCKCGKLTNIDLSGEQLVEFADSEARGHDIKQAEGVKCNAVGETHVQSQPRIINENKLDQTALLEENRTVSEKQFVEVVENRQTYPERAFDEKQLGDQNDEPDRERSHIDESTARGESGQNIKHDEGAKCNDDHGENQQNRAAIHTGNSRNTSLSNIDGNTPDQPALLEGNSEVNVKRFAEVVHGSPSAMDLQRLPVDESDELVTSSPANTHEVTVDNTDAEYNDGSNNGMRDINQSNASYEVMYRNANYSEPTGKAKKPIATSHSSATGDGVQQWVQDGRHYISISRQSSEMPTEWRDIVISLAAGQAAHPIKIGQSSLPRDLPCLQSGGIPLSNVLHCLPHGSTFREPIIVQISLSRRSEGPIEIWYNDTDTERASRWRSVGELTSDNRRIFLNDGLDGMRNEAVLRDDNNMHVVLYLIHFCSFVIVEQNCRRWRRSTLKVFLLYIADSDVDKSIVNINCKVFVNSDTVSDERVVNF